VGKVSNNSPTFIEPVSERSDGIKSFFQKQTPAKPKADMKPSSSIKKDIKPKSESVASSFIKEETKPKLESIPPTPSSVKKEVKSERAIKSDPSSSKVEEGIESIITEDDKEPGLGDDSNAPNQSDQPSDIKPKKQGKLHVEPKVQDTKPATRTRAGKRKADDDEIQVVEEPQQRKAGHQTAVIRKNADEGNKAVSE
jgi:hypothetical protein